MAFFRKDASLDQLARTHNVAQFVSFSPAKLGPIQQFCRVRGFEANYRFQSTAVAVESLLNASNSHMVNIRSYNANEMQSREFIYGLTDARLIELHLERLSQEGAFTILNETINVSDGGVSGVVLGDVVEFRPDATPRGVEKPGFASLPRDWAQRLLSIVYGFGIEFPKEKSARVEFSIHPIKAGWRRSHLLFWEYEEHANPLSSSSIITWPNDFSRLIGDKAYGLLMAHLCGELVPYTTVIGRRVAPFSFGRQTGSGDVWLRTCPVEQVPGKFTTVLGWVDPFRLLQQEDPESDALASVLSQQSIDSSWSGACIETADGKVVIEGVEGYGDRFMQGEHEPESLPQDVQKQVLRVANDLKRSLGPVRFEWAYDGSNVWVLQLHHGRSASKGHSIVPGEAQNWRDFDIRDGLEALRKLLTDLSPDEGILLNGNVGLTSHIADVVRRAGIPTRIQK